MPADSSQSNRDIIQRPSPQLTGAALVHPPAPPLPPLPEFPGHSSAFIIQDVPSLHLMGVAEGHAHSDLVGLHEPSAHFSGLLEGQPLPAAAPPGVAPPLPPLPEFPGHSSAFITQDDPSLHFMGVAEGHAHFAWLGLHEPSAHFVGLLEGQPFAPTAAPPPAAAPPSAGGGAGPGVAPPLPPLPEFPGHSSAFITQDVPSLHFMGVLEGQPLPAAAPPSRRRLCRATRPRCSFNRLRVFMADALDVVEIEALPSLV